MNKTITVGYCRYVHPKSDLVKHTCPSASALMPSVAFFRYNLYTVTPPNNVIFESIRNLNAELTQTLEDK